jgi:hypothetical protein
LLQCISYTGVKGSHLANKKTKSWIQQKSKGVNRRHLWSGAPNCPVCHRTVSGVPPDMSGAPEDSNANSPPSGISRGNSAIIHRTVRCTPDSVRCSKGERPQELAGFGNLQRLVRYNSPDMSGVHRTIRCNPGATAISAPTVTCDAFNARTARAEGRRAHTGAPDNEQEMSGVHRTSRGAHKSGAPTVRI